MAPIEILMWLVNIIYAISVLSIITYLIYSILEGKDSVEKITINVVVYIILFTIVLVVVNIEYVNYTRKMIGLKENNLYNIKNSDDTKSTYVCADVTESGECDRAKSRITENSTKEDTLDCEYMKKRNKYICDLSEEEYTKFIDLDANEKKGYINDIDNESKQFEPIDLSWGQIAFIITIFLIVIIIIFLYYERYGNVYILLAAIIASLIFIFVFFYIFNVSSAISSNLLRSELEKMTLEELRYICVSRGLPPEGSKTEIINRILSDNN